MINLDHCVSFLSKLHIRDRESGLPVPFHLRKNQLQIIEQLKEQQAKGRPLRFVSAKSRRVGVSSLMEGLGVCFGLATPGVDSRIIAHLDDSVTELFKVPVGLIKELKERVAPELPIPTADRIIFPHGRRNSTLSIATAGSTRGGRGAGFYFLHLSEVAFYTSPDALLSLLSTVPDHPNTIIGIESTANGRVGIGQPFYDLWNASVRGDTEFIPIFLSWLDDPGCVRDPAGAHDAPIDEEEKDLIKYHNATKAQLAWRRWALANRCGGSIDRLHQEFPVTAEESFISSGNPAFSQEEVRKARASVRKPLFVGYIDRLGKYVAAENGGLKVWAKPIHGGERDSHNIALEPHKYYVGVDSARGLEYGGHDFAAISVIDGSTNEIVARYTEKIGPEALAAVVDSLARSYNNALVIIELTGNLGLWVQKTLRDKFRYSNLYRWIGRDDKVQRGKPNALGWETNYRTRELLFTAFREAIREGGLQVCDEMIVTQMDMAQRDAVSDSVVTKGYDDALFAAMLANIACRHYPPPKIWGSKSPEKDAAEKQLPITIKDDHAMSLQRHLAKVKQYDRVVKQGDRLEGI